MGKVGRIAPRGLGLAVPNVGPSLALCELGREVILTQDAVGGTGICGTMNGAASYTAMAFVSKEREREWRREWRKRRRHQQRDRYMADKSCEECGSGMFLELHHLDPAKKETHRIWDFAWHRILKEAAKCMVLCRTCHKKHHPHGWQNGSKDAVSS